MSTGSRTSTILVAVDGSPESDAAVAWAARESAIRHASVTLMNVIAPVLVTVPMEPMFYGPEWFENCARHILDHAELDLRSSLAAPNVAVAKVMGRGHPVGTLADASKDAQMLVVGSRGLGAVKSLTLGSVSNGLLHHAHCPVAVIRADQADVRADAPVLVGVDGTETSEAATELAFDEASRRGVGVTALHVWSDFGLYMTDESDWHRYQREAEALLAEHLDQWTVRYPDVHVRHEVVCDEPAYRITEAARHAQLVVVGSRGRGGFTGMLLGSTSSAVARTSSVPVIVVRD